MHREVFAGRDAALLTVGEMPGVTVEQARLFTDPARAEVDMVFQFEHVGLDQGTSKWDVRPLRMRDLKASFGRWQAGLADVGWNSLYWDNHDQPRAVSRYGDDSPEFRRDSATCLATLLHLHRGTPYVYQGQEIGMANFPFASVDDFRDVESVNHFGAAMVAGEDPTAVLAALRRMSRDNARTPVQWDASPSAGFTTGTPWLPVNPDHVEWNADAQRTDPSSVLAHYRRLIALRHENPVVALGDFAMLLPEHDDVYAFTRTLDGDVLLVVCNLSRTPYPLAGLLPQALDGELVLGNLAASDPAVLAPWEARVLRDEVRPRFSRCRRGRGGGRGRGRASRGRRRRRPSRPSRTSRSAVAAALAGCPVRGGRHERPAGPAARPWRRRGGAGSARRGGWRARGRRRRCAPGARPGAPGRATRARPVRTRGRVAGPR